MEKEFMEPTIITADEKRTEEERQYFNDQILVTEAMNFALNALVNGIENYDFHSNLSDDQKDIIVEQFEVVKALNENTLPKKFNRNYFFDKTKDKIVKNGQCYFVNNDDSLTHIIPDDELPVS